MNERQYINGLNGVEWRIVEESGVVLDMEWIWNG